MTPSNEQDQTAKLVSDPGPCVTRRFFCMNVYITFVRLMIHVSVVKSQHSFDQGNNE